MPSARTRRPVIGPASRRAGAVDGPGRWRRGTTPSPMRCRRDRAARLAGGHSNATLGRGRSLAAIPSMRAAALTTAAPVQSSQRHATPQRQASHHHAPIRMRSDGRAAAGHAIAGPMERGQRHATPPRQAGHRHAPIRMRGDCGAAALPMRAVRGLCRRAMPATRRGRALLSLSVRGSVKAGGARAWRAYSPGLPCVTGCARIRVCPRPHRDCGCAPFPRHFPSAVSQFAAAHTLPPALPKGAC